MPITINPKSPLFWLDGKTFSYGLCADEAGRLMHLYWGAKLPRPLSCDGAARLLASYKGGASFDLREARLPWEAPSRWAGWYGTPSIQAINNNGNDITNMLYTGYELIQGKPPLPGLPATYTETNADASTLIITLKDQLTGLTARLSYTVFEELDTLTRSMELTNNGMSPLQLTHMMSASIPLYSNNYDVIYLNGGWARERHIKREPVGHAITRIESQRGASGHEYNPWVCLAAPNADEFSGECRAMTLVYSGSFLAEARADNGDGTRLTIGLNPETHEWRIEPDASFQTPEAVLTYSAEGLNGLSHRTHELFSRRLCRGFWRDKPRPILINNWEATYFNFDADKIAAIARRAKDIGVEVMVLDDGWFGRRDDDHSSLGDWVEDRRKLPEGLAALAKRINDIGLKFGLWFEPEMISPDSELYRAHPDWCLHGTDRVRTEARNQLILDFSREDVQDYIISSVSAVLENAPISYVKWDMNRNMTEPFTPSRDRALWKETQHRYMLGLYRVLEAIVSRFPEVLFESCSGGGGRFDAGLLYYMPQVWTSDDTDPVERLRIQYGTSTAYPPSSICAHVSASPNHQTGRATSMAMRCDTAFGWNFGFELDLNRLNEADLRTAREAVERVKQLRDALKGAEFTRLASPFDGDIAAWQWLSADGNTLALCVFQPLSRPNPTPRRVYPRRLEVDAEYILAATGEVWHGGELMHIGLDIKPSHDDFASEVYLFQKK